MRTVSAIFAMLVLLNWISAVAALVICITDFSIPRLIGSTVYLALSALVVYWLTLVLDRYATG